MSIENRSSSALFKRAEQLKRWEESETNRETIVPKRKSKKIQFSSGVVFLAACAAGEKEEVLRLLQQGADINTANVDGLTALHQLCIDDNLDMVEFLVEHGADVNRGDNEGWTPLHATVSCGFVSIAKYLIEHGANVAAVNNDAELPVDLAETDEMEDMLRQVLNSHGIDCDEARNEEERMMLADAKEWLNGGESRDVPHPKTGATALHVAAAKGYIKVIRVLLQAGADINVQDYDGWTPLHAAAYWVQKEACELLVENFCDMEITNCVGQTALDVADPEVVPLLEELKKKQAVLQRDRGDSNAILQKKGATPQKRRSSITRMSVSDKSNLINKDTSSERQLLEGSNKVKTVELEIESQAEDSTRDVVAANEVEKKNRVNRDETPRIPLSQEVNKTVPSVAPSSPPLTPTENDESPLFISRRPGSLRNRQCDGHEEPSNKPLISRIGEKDKATSPTAGSNTSDVVLRRTQSFEADEKRALREESKGSSDLPSTTATPTTTTSTVTTTTTASPTATSPVPTVQVRRSFVPPVRDEESETQRKAHAKRVRETRRSTQGVTLEEIKSAEQLVKKKNQQQLHQATQQLNNNDQPVVLIPTTTNNNNNTVTATATITASSTPKDNAEDVSVQERRPSWRLRVDNGDRNKFLLEDVRNTPSTLDNRSSVDSSTTYLRRPSPGHTPARPASAPVEPSSPTDTSITLPLRRSKPPDDKEQDKENDIRNAQATQAVIQRRRRPKRRSTGVVHVDMDEIDPERQDSPGRADTNDVSKSKDDESGGDWPSQSSRLSNSPSGDSRAVTPAARGSKDVSNENGEIDYKKLYEVTLAENERLKDLYETTLTGNERLKEQLKKTESDLQDAKSQLEKLPAGSTKNSLSEMEKRERRAMERKLSEMEEELKQLQKLKAENERLKAENRALTRVVSKLTNSANATK
ncbi:protein phosphatase 1 regulatory subunit 12A isoform X2 [Anabrus simplex]|uniref:protein phosphatase 1 regulatory subunit 12A isoform X2 n=1 Tax=Anabrus simplex TaxID=316456 RepID=UPI0035A3A90F